MQKMDIVGLDLAKNIFQVHAIAADGAVVVKRQLRRSQVLIFFARLPSCLIGMEACAGAHFWAREIKALGHQVRLMPPGYVKPDVKRGKTDAGDAEAICEAVTCPTMRFVPVKSAEQQAAAIVLKTHDDRPRSSWRCDQRSTHMQTGPPNGGRSDPEHDAPLRRDLSLTSGGTFLDSGSVTDSIDN